MKSNWTLFVVLALLCGCGGEASSRPPKHVRFCELAGDAGDYNRMLVSFHAQIDSNGMDQSALTDSACPGQGAGFDVTQAQGSFEAARRVLMEVGQPGTVDKIVEADFTGVVHLKNDRPLIYLTDVRNVSYRMTDEVIDH